LFSYGKAEPFREANKGGEAVPQQRWFDCGSAALGNLGVLLESLVEILAVLLTTRGTENTEVAQRRTGYPHQGGRGTPKTYLLLVGKLKMN